MYDAAPPGSGQSAGQSRLFRHAHDDSRLVAMAVESRAIWREWQNEFGVELICPDGAVALGPAATERLRVLAGFSDALVRPIDAAELAERVPLLARYEGPATVRVTFAVRGDPPRRLATLQDSSGAFGATGVYASPYPGSAHFAVGLNEHVPTGEDGALADPHGLAAIVDRTVAYVEQALPELDPTPVGHVHGWTTELPWGSDAIAVWETPWASFVAGHNLFKHAPALGRSLVRYVLDGRVPAHLRPGARLGG